MDERIRQDHRLAEAEALERLRALQPEREVSQRITEQALSLAPVSYTHLTLPTIYSV